MKNSSQNTPSKDGSKNNKVPISLIGIVIGFFCFFGFLAYSFFSNIGVVDKPVKKCQTYFSSYDVVEKNIKGNKYRLLVADTDAKHTQGLMNIKSKKEICDNDGMIFVFDNPGIQTFWNQNTLIDLKLYWMLGDKPLREDTLVNITDNGLKIYSSILPVNVVVEIIKK